MAAKPKFLKPDLAAPSLQSLLNAQGTTVTTSKHFWKCRANLVKPLAFAISCDLSANLPIVLLRSCLHSLDSLFNNSLQ